MCFQIVMPVPLRPCIHDRKLLRLQALASIAQLTMLTELRVACCNKLTGNGTPRLAALSRLRVLALQGCLRIGDGALLQLLPHLPRLSHLNIGGCCRVSTALRVWRQRLCAAAVRLPAQPESILPGRTPAA
jgi:hypothetical protein